VSVHRPVRVAVWKKLGAGQGWAWVTDLDAWAALEVEARYVDVGTFTLTLPYDAQAEKVLTNRKQLLTFDLDRPAGSLPYYRLMTGRITRLSPRLADDGRLLVEVSGTDLLARIGHALMWAQPTLAIGSQGTVRWSTTGAAETALRTMLVANIVTRRGEEVTIPASAGRGGTVTIRNWFGNLLEVAQRKEAQGGVGVRRGLVDMSSRTRAAETISFVVPADRSNRVRLSHRTRTLRTWGHEATGPSVTRAITARGDGASRVMRQSVNTADETLWAEKIEVYVEASGAEDNAEQDEAGQEALTAGASAESFDLAAVEATGTLLGTHFDVGDTVKVELPTGLAVNTRLSAVRLTGGEGGIAVALIPGNPDAVKPLFTLVRLIKGLRRALSHMQRERGI
jgi:hypothetical protein